MTLLRVFPLLVLLAACSTPPQLSEIEDINPGPDCEGACAAGYRWALEEDLTSDAKCRGEHDFARGCRRAVEFSRTFGV